MSEREKTIETIPVGPLGIIPLSSSQELGNKVDGYLSSWRKARESEHTDSIIYSGYQKDSYQIKACCPRFGTGEAKGTIKESVRGVDLYLLVDVTNYSLTYTVSGNKTTCLLRPLSRFKKNYCCWW